MSEWTLIAALLAVVWLLRVCATRAELVAVQADRIAVLERALEREQAKTVNRFKPRPLPGWVTEPAGSVAALPAGKPELEALPLGSFLDPPVIDLAYDAASTQPLPVIGWVDPMRSDHDAYRPHWPGTKENAHAR